jgi:hypothetical protein
MSDLELSSVVDDIEYRLPVLIPPSSLLQLSARPSRQLPPTQSVLFTKNLYSRTILDTHPAKMQYICMQQGCSYSPEPRQLSYNTTSNLWKHIEQRHPAIFESIKRPKQDENSNTNLLNRSSFFEPRPRVSAPIMASQYRELLLAFIVSNNLPLRLVDQFSFRQLVHHLSPSTIAISASSLKRDLHKKFCNRRIKLELELQNHLATGGRLSLTTDAWTANNGSNYATITVHWINSEWIQQSKILDVIHLQEPIHSGEYLAEQLLIVTNDFKITHGVFTITRDNASNNTAMLNQYEIRASKNPVTVNQPWSFTVKEGDVRCIAHVINLAVQAALATMKAIPFEELESYRVREGLAHTRLVFSEKDEVVNALTKLRKHIYVFRNRRAWKDALSTHATATGIKPIALSIDMPVRWNSTYYMLEHALAMEAPITALCASQTLDISMRDIIISTKEWELLHNLEDFFKIFKRASEKVQADGYPTLNYCLPYYLRLMNKIKIMKKTVKHASIAEACTIAFNKLDDYYSLATAQRSSHSTIATICDPRFNYSIFDYYLPESFHNISKDRAKAQFATCFNRYKAREDDIKTATIQAIIDIEEEAAISLELDSEDEMFKPRGLHIQEIEWRRWLNEPGVEPNTDILKYWHAKQYQYPIIAKMARDHLAIPATSAASERVFSNGADILTKNRNRLLPSTVRYLLCLRNWGVIQDNDDDDIDVSNSSE